MCVKPKLNCICEEGGKITTFGTPSTEELQFRKSGFDLLMRKGQKIIIFKSALIYPNKIPPLAFSKKFVPD